MTGRDIQTIAQIRGIDFIWSKAHFVIWEYSAITSAVLTAVLAIPAKKILAGYRPQSFPMSILYHKIKLFCRCQKKPHCIDYAK